MLIGLERLTEKFKNLADQNKMGQNYLFFGDAGVGKFAFAKCLANYLESGVFELPRRILTDVLILRSESEEVLGIETAKQAKSFLWQKPFISSRRTVIVNQADNLTSEAQNVFLKLAEEPPVSGFIIMIASNLQPLSPAFLSRFAKIYFPRLSSPAIIRYLTDARGLDAKIAQKIAEISFGRVGRAIELVENKSTEIAASACFDKTFEKYYIILRKDLKKNVSKLSRLLKRHSLLKEYNLNQKLQLKAAENIFNG